LIKDQTIPYRRRFCYNPASICKLTFFRSLDANNESNQRQPRRQPAACGHDKGAFLFRSDGAREKWERAGPYFPGRSIYALAHDGRNGRKRLWAAVNSPFWGSFLSSSNDFGLTWSDPETYNIKFPEGSDVSLKQIWQIAEGHPNEPDTLYCGVEPAALFKSADAGETWSLDRGLFDHPHRTQWMPGGGGLCLHTILPDPSNPDRMFVAIS